MFKHILVATDGSALADKAVDLASQLARTCGEGTRVTALMVVPDYTTLEYAEVILRDSPTFDELRGSLAAEGRRRLDAILSRRGSAARMERSVAVGDYPHAEIIKTAERLGCDLIVMAARGRSALQSALLGSQTSHVLSQAGVPVLVVK